MALRTEAQWKTFFQSAKITNETTQTNYAKIFADNSLTELSLEGLDKDTLTELGINVIGDRLSILQCAKNKRAPSTPSTVAKASVTAKLPTLTHEMTQPQFRKFQQDWTVYKLITALELSKAAAHLYHTSDEAVQTSLLNTYPDFLTMDEEAALEAIETIVTVRINPAVHRKAFGELSQGEKETIQTFVVRLRSSASDCAFECPNCQHDLASVNIKDQLIRGLYHASLQAEILAKADQLKTLDDIIKYAEAFETALRDQSSLSLNNDTGNVFGVHGKGKNRRQKTPKPPTQPCKGCGGTNHGPNRATECPGWGKECFECGKMNHLATVCLSKDSSSG